MASRKTKYDEEMLEKVAKYLRANLPCKQRPLGKQTMDYFSGKRMINFLLESEFAKGDDGFLRTRADALKLANELLRNEQVLFFRAEFAEKQIKKKDGSMKTKKVLKPLPQREIKFVDDDVPYVWVYNPVTRSTVMYGLLLIGFIVCCAALPLWPIWLRNTVAGFLLFLVIGRPALQFLVYLITFSRWKFVIWPNLEEEKPMAFKKRFQPLFVFEKYEDDKEEEEEEEGEGEGEDGEGDGDEGEGKDGEGDEDDGDGEE
eukprot:m.62169 g.62169  ORF g.62169 m.62169 type:complete len:259 (+) comp11491_c0_seq2:106-882(+)